MPDSLEGKIYRGEEARRFLSTPIGKMIIEAAEKEEMLSLEALATVDPHNEKEIMDIQQDIRVARAVPLWILHKGRENDNRSHPRGRFNGSCARN